MKLSIARIYYPVKVLGPGNRVGIWTTGCYNRCEGCISPELQSYNPQNEMTVSDIVNFIQKIKGSIDGFTISGGEPFYQPESLGYLLEALACIKDDIIVFTGYTLEELIGRKDKAVEKALKYCSVLVDGPYIKANDDGVGMRGSSNQKIRVFNHHQRYQGLESVERQIQAVMYGEKVWMIGIPKG